MRSVAAAVAAAWLPCAAAAAQDGDAVQRTEQRLRLLDAQYRSDVPPGAGAGDRFRLDAGGSAQLGLYSIDDDESESHVLRQWDGRAWAHARLDATHSFFGRLKFRYDDWNSGDDFDGQGDDLREPLGERWWYQFAPGGRRGGAGGGAGWDLSFKAGKQFVHWGEGLALSEALIAAVVEAEWNGLALDLLAGETPANDFVDFDTSRPSFDTNTKRRFLGALLEWRGGGVTPFAHVLRQIDRNDRDFALFVDGLGQLYPTSFEYDSTYYGAGARGSLGARTSWRAELGFETGRGQSSPVDANGAPGPQTEEDVCAWAFAGGLTRLFLDERRTRADFELIAASGDDDRLDSADTFGGNLSATDDTAWNAFGFVNTGLALAPEPSNLVTVRIGAATSPWAGRGGEIGRLRAVVDGFLFLKIDPDAPLNVATTGHRFVGGEIDVGFDWNLLSDVALAFRYGLFMPGPAMPDGQDGARQILYGSVTYAF